MASLIRVRHIRNLYAHEDEVFIDYDESDIVFIKDFYHRILNGQDPLTLLRKQRENTTTKIKRKTSPENIDKYIVSEEGNSSSGELTDKNYNMGSCVGGINHHSVTSDNICLKIIFCKG